MFENGKKIASSLDDFNRADVLKNMSGILTSYAWDFAIIKCPAILENSKDYLNKILRLRKNQIQPPDNPVNSPVQARLPGYHMYTQPGRTDTMATLAFSFQDYVDSFVDKLFTLYIYAASDPYYKTTLLPITEYKWDFELLRYSPDGRPVKRWLCKDCTMNAFSRDESMINEENPIGLSTIQFIVDHNIQQFYNNGKWEGDFLMTDGIDSDYVHKWVLNGATTSTSNTSFYGCDYYNWDNDKLRYPMLIDESAWKEAKN